MNAYVPQWSFDDEEYFGPNNDGYQSEPESRQPQPTPLASTKLDSGDDEALDDVPSEDRPSDPWPQGEADEFVFAPAIRYSDVVTAKNAGEGMSIGGGGGGAWGGTRNGPGMWYGRIATGDKLVKNVDGSFEDRYGDYDLIGGNPAKIVLRKEFDPPPNDKNQLLKRLPSSEKKKRKMEIQDMAREFAASISGGLKLQILSLSTQKRVDAIYYMDPTMKLFDIVLVDRLNAPSDVCEYSNTEVNAILEMYKNEAIKLRNPALPAHYCKTSIGFVIEWPPDVETKEKGLTDPCVLVFGSTYERDRFFVGIQILRSVQPYSALLRIQSAIRTRLKQQRKSMESTSTETSVSEVKPPITAFKESSVARSPSPSITRTASGSHKPQSTMSRVSRLSEAPPESVKEVQSFQSAKSKPTTITITAKSKAKSPSFTSMFDKTWSELSDDDTGPLYAAQSASTVLAPVERDPTTYPTASGESALSRPNVPVSKYEPTTPVFPGAETPTFQQNTTSPNTPPLPRPPPPKPQSSPQKSGGPTPYGAAAPKALPNPKEASQLPTPASPKSSPSPSPTSPPPSPKRMEPTGEGSSTITTPKAAPQRKQTMQTSAVATPMSEGRPIPAVLLRPAENDEGSEEIVHKKTGWTREDHLVEDQPKQSLTKPELEQKMAKSPIYKESPMRSAMADEMKKRREAMEGKAEEKVIA
eukprot:GHVP01033488.1.p1 GENE.GHVP01033488.1~~GHVP01033488.1.p1  ORF type:complete len:697 (+),score=143.35 GHVP01033488.1:1276-3366(+)